jgi:hypothetical protein
MLLGILRSLSCDAFRATAPSLVPHVVARLLTTLKPLVEPSDRPMNTPGNLTRRISLQDTFYRLLPELFFACHMDTPLSCKSLERSNCPIHAFSFVKERFEIRFSFVNDVLL